VTVEVAAVVGVLREDDARGMEHCTVMTWSRRCQSVL